MIGFGRTGGVVSGMAKIITLRVRESPPVDAIVVVVDERDSVEFSGGGVRFHTTQDNLGAVLMRASTYADMRYAEAVYVVLGLES